MFVWRICLCSCENFCFCLVDQWLTLASHLGLVALPNYGIGQYQLRWSTRRGLGICLIHWILDFAAHASCYFPATQYSTMLQLTKVHCILYSTAHQTGSAPQIEEQHPWWRSKLEQPSLQRLPTPGGQTSDWRIPCHCFLTAQSWSSLSLDLGKSERDLRHSEFGLWLILQKLNNHPSLLQLERSHPGYLHLCLRYPNWRTQWFKIEKCLKILNWTVDLF